MQIQQINKSDAETVSIIVKNVDGGGSITTGNGVCLVVTGASIDGLSAVKSTAANQRGFVGIAVQDVPINSYGLVRSWGIVSSVLLSHVGSSLTITRGDTLIPGAVSGTFFSSVTDQAFSTLHYKYVIAGSTPAAISAAAYCTGLVRAL